jgi:hypothetical protein
MTKPTHTSPRKADANRRNAAKSTGPRTPQGKAHSRLNAMKHGILASQTVIATLEGYRERKMFEATVEGLERDFEPAGTYEQLLVQEIAACFWRKRRLLMFENRAAFEALDRPAMQFINAPDNRALMRPSVYLHNGKLVAADYVYADAGLDRITMPSEADTMRIVRYEAAINRTREKAVAELRERRKAHARVKGAPAAREQAAPIVDLAAKRRNARRSTATLLSPLMATAVYDKFEAIGMDAEIEREAALQAELYGTKGSPTETAENDQTKPKNLRDMLTPEVIRGIMDREIDPDEWREEQKKLLAKGSGGV